MYENRHGRFTAVDPLLASGKSANPQTFNRYVYVGNNPVFRTDPSGLDWYFKDGQYRWSSDNRYFDILSGGSIGELTNPTSVSESWTRVQLDGNGEYRYSTESAPGLSTEVILKDSIWWPYGKTTIVDQAAYDTHIAEKNKLASDMIGALVEGRAMDNALRPLTDVRTGSNPTAPGRLGFIFDRMKPSADGSPEIGSGAFNLRSRSNDLNKAQDGNVIPGNGMSVSPTTSAFPFFKQNEARGSVFCLPCRSLPYGLQIGMDKKDSNHLFIQPARPIRPESFTDMLHSTRQFWFVLPERK